MQLQKTKACNMEKARDITGFTQINKHKPNYERDTSIKYFFAPALNTRRLMDAP